MSTGKKKRKRLLQLLRRNPLAACPRPVFSLYAQGAYMNPRFRMVKIFSALMAVLLAPSAWAQSSGFTVVASGLNGPRGLKFGPDGALYVAEAGSGGDSGGFSCEQVPSP